MTDYSGSNLTDEEGVEASVAHCPAHNATSTGCEGAAVKAEGFEMQGVDGYKAEARVRSLRHLPCDRHAAGATEKGVETMASTRLFA